MICHFKLTTIAQTIAKYSNAPFTSLNIWHDCWQRQEFVSYLPGLLKKLLSSCDWAAIHLQIPLDSTAKQSVHATLLK